MELYLFSLVLVGVLAQSMAAPIIMSNHIDSRLENAAIKSPIFCKGLECPKYTLTDKNDDYELRKYEAAYWVSTDIYDVGVKGAENQAFLHLLDYISGGNAIGAVMDMTAPLINHVTPCVDAPLCKKSTYSFFVPLKYQRSGPPEPNNKNVYISTIPEHSAYVRQFIGRAEDWTYQAKYQADILTKYLKIDGHIDQVDQTFFHTACYDAPFQLFNRHNEVWFFVKDAANGGSGNAVSSSSESATLSGDPVSSGDHGDAEVSSGDNAEVSSGDGPSANDKPGRGDAPGDASGDAIPSGNAVPSGDFFIAQSDNFLLTDVDGIPSQDNKLRILSGDFISNDDDVPNRADNKIRMEWWDWQ